MWSVYLPSAASSLLRAAECHCALLVALCWHPDDTLKLCACKHGPPAEALRCRAIERPGFVVLGSEAATEMSMGLQVPAASISGDSCSGNTSHVEQQRHWQCLRQDLMLHTIPVRRLVLSQPASVVVDHPWQRYSACKRHGCWLQHHWARLPYNWQH